MGSAAITSDGIPPSLDAHPSVGLLTLSLAVLALS